MSHLMKIGGAVALLAIPATALAQPVEITAHAMVEQRKAAADGTTKITLANAARVTPGDRIVYQLSYRNSGREPARDLVIANPVPANMTYAGAVEGSAEPELSVDGTKFGSLAQLTARAADGRVRPALATDVRVVRWRLATPVAAGGSGQVAFRAILK
jgi:uncharacterized repeat protein (TIGR01451 family)